MTNLLDASTFIDPGEIADFTANLLEASTEYSIIGEDLDGRILLFNVGARRHYGYESSEVVGKLSDILHAPADVAAGLPAAMRAAALADGKWEGAVLRKRKDGSAFTARVVLTPRHNAAGKPIGYLLISKDISSEIRLTEELEATQFYTRSLIESNIDALMTTDPVGAITDVNQQMEWLTGRTRGELIGSPFKQFFTDPVRAEDGRETVVSYNATTFNDREGKLQGVFAAARDVTEHKALEEQATRRTRSSREPGSACTSARNWPGSSAA
jgi:PAS domain S-box-containing protein